MMTNYIKLSTPVAPISEQTPVVMEGAGVGVNVFVFDTGVNPHEQLSGRIYNLNNLAYTDESPYCPEDTIVSVAVFEARDSVV